MTHNHSLIASAILSVIAVVALSGCVTVKDTVYLNELSVSGPIQQPPVHLSKDVKGGDVHIIPRFSINQRRGIDGSTGGGTYPTDVMPVPIVNFHWKMPTSQFGLDFDWSVTDGFALTGGVTAAAVDGEDLWGGNFGIGLPFGGNPIAGRFDAGVQLQTMSFDAYSVLVREVTPWYSSTTERSVGYFHDIDHTTPWNIYGSLTLNSVSTGFLNGFANIAVSRQTTASFAPKHVYELLPFVEYMYTDTRADNTATFLIFTPGISFTLSPAISLLTGFRVLQQFPPDMDATTLFAPMIQLDFKP